MKIYLKVFAVLLSVPLAFASAVGEVTLSADTSIISVNSKNWNVTGNSAVLDSITVSGSSFSLTMSAGQTLKISSSDKLTISMSETGSIQGSFTCGSSESTYTITNPSGGATATFTVTPGTSACSSGGGIVGGDGAPVVPPQTVIPAPVLAPV